MDLTPISSKRPPPSFSLFGELKKLFFLRFGCTLALPVSENFVAIHEKKVWTLGLTILVVVYRRHCEALL